MESRRRPFRRLKLRTILLVALLLSGIIPLGISSLLLIPQSEAILRGSEQDNLTRDAVAVSRSLGAFLTGVRRQLANLGTFILTAPGPDDPAERLREPWVATALQGFRRENPDLQAIRVLENRGLGLAPGNLTDEVRTAMDGSFETARETKRPAYQLAGKGPTGEPLAVVAVPVAAAGDAQLIVQALVGFEPLESMYQSRPGQSFYLIDGQGKILWSYGGTPQVDEAMKASEAVRAFIAQRSSATTEQKVNTDTGTRTMLMQLSALGESGWGLAVMKPLNEAFPQVRKMIFNAVLSTVLLVALAMLSAFLASRWVGRPIQLLAEKTHEIAEGSFGTRVPSKGLAFELADLADDFNRMSGHVETYVARLKQAAHANRDLFIGSLRAFAAAIDAKDPYTRGHSERVAAASRTIARFLQLPEETQHKVWIGALLHDVGKIGVEDNILRKEGVLAADEYEQMKMHTVIGAEILAPIEQLREMIPAIRWHHEAWNGRGYPDGLKGEQIPLYARIVAVADTFDAITTNRPYQQAYSLQFAVETITRLAGSRFDAKIVTAFLRAFEAGEIRSREGRPARVEAEPLARVAQR